MTAALHDHVEDRTNRTEGQGEGTTHTWSFRIVATASFGAVAAEVGPCRGCRGSRLNAARQADSGRDGSHRDIWRRSRLSTWGTSQRTLGRTRGLHCNLESHFFCTSSTPRARRYVSVGWFGARGKEFRPSREGLASVSVCRRRCGRCAGSVEGLRVRV